MPRPISTNTVLIVPRWTRDILFKHGLWHSPNTINNFYFHFTNTLNNNNQTIARIIIILQWTEHYAFAHSVIMVYSCPNNSFIVHNNCRIALFFFYIKIERFCNINKNVKCCRILILLILSSCIIIKCRFTRTNMIAHRCVFVDILYTQILRVRMFFPRICVYTNLYV